MPSSMRIPPPAWRIWLLTSSLVALNSTTEILASGGRPGSGDASTRSKYTWPELGRLMLRTSP
jgi:hypothetical protein